MTWQISELVMSFLDHLMLLCNNTRHQRSVEAARTHYGTQTVGLVIVLLFVHVQAQTDALGHDCMGCLLFKQEYTRPSEKEKKETELCHYPCQCEEELGCQDGVSVVKDGCGCCLMCARQIGDLCSVRDVCDSSKGLFCDKQDLSSTGSCKGKDKNPCMVGDIMYKDGEKFQLECSQLCTCQNGFYGCVNNCAQELMKPSEVTCHEPKLIQVKDECCKEWTCQKMEASGESVLASNGLKSENLVLPNSVWHSISTLSPFKEATSLATTFFQLCEKKTTDWTPCSITCDVGVSMRIVVDPISCNDYQELQLCYIRPCVKIVDTISHRRRHHLQARKKCTATTRRTARHHIQYQDCISIRDYSLKFCSNCKKDKCCYPRRSVTRPMEFQCSEGKREVFNYMWIKKCSCAPTCSLLHRNSSKRRGQGRRRGKKVRQHRGKRRRLNL